MAPEKLLGGPGAVKLERPGGDLLPRAVAIATPVGSWGSAARSQFLGASERRMSRLTCLFGERVETPDDCLLIRLTHGHDHRIQYQALDAV